MRAHVGYESDGFESGPESLQFGELDSELGGGNRSMGRCRCGCGQARGGAMAFPQAEYSTEQREYEIPGWLNPAYRLYRAGRLGWRAGRFVDKMTGKVFGKPISKMGGDLLFKMFGRRKALEDAFDRLPMGVKRWLNNL